MVSLEDTLREEMDWYSANGQGLNTRLYLMADPKRHAYSVTAIDYPARKWSAGVVVFARIEGGSIIIEEDNTDRPLVDRLMARGIPREKIVLAYAGETVMQPE
jgi:hypothetical protein